MSNEESVARKAIRELQQELLAHTAEARRMSRIGCAHAIGWDFYMTEEGWYAYATDVARRRWSSLHKLELIGESQARLFLSLEWAPLDPRSPLELLGMEAE